MPADGNILDDVLALVLLGGFGCSLLCFLALYSDITVSKVVFDVTHIAVRCKLIAVYVVAGWNHVLKGRDLRGITWERDFDTDQLEIHHVSDGPLHVNNVDFTVVPEGAKCYEDRKMRRITKGSWEHIRWFIRGFYDMYLNVSNLLRMIEDLEGQYDPMSQWVSRYGCAVFRDQDYAYGSTGHLFSNFAVKTLVNNVAVFDSCPSDQGEDLCLYWIMRKLNLPFYESCSTKFVVTFPSDIKNLTVKKICPEYSTWAHQTRLRIGYTPVIGAVAYHMHNIPMELWMDWLKQAMAANISVVFHSGAKFCTPPDQ
jgi:hypothetical protein